jgi:hypothetical protein
MTIMRSYRRAGVLFLAMTMIGCDPLFTTSYRQSLAPAPPPQCIARTLATSSLVTSIAPLGLAEGSAATDSFRVALRDTATTDGGWTMTVTRAVAPDSAAHLTVAYSYPGFAPPTSTEQQRIAVEVAALIGAVRIACAPNSPPAIICHSAGGLGGRRGACRAAA